MYRGTTPTIIFKLNTDLDLTTLTQIWVTMQDMNDSQYTWDIDDVTIDNTGKTISLPLSQEETLVLSNGMATVQIRLLTSENKALATNVAMIDINNILKDGVIE